MLAQSQAARTGTVVSSCANPVVQRDLAGWGGASWIATGCDYRPVGGAGPEPSTTPSDRPPPTPPAAAAGRPQTFWLHLNSTATSDAMLAAEARRRSFIVLNAWEGNLIPKLKAANPAIQVYVYKDLSSTRSYACRNGTDDTHLPAGVGYCDADANHRDWFLTASDTDMLPEYGEGWSRVIGQIETNEARGKITWVQPHFSAGAARPFRYAFASYLMAAGGRAAFTAIARTDDYGDPTPWHPEYDWNLGAATEARAAVGTNLWRRTFTCGLAVVNANPTSSGPQSVALGGAYLDQDGRTVSSVSLAGTSGAVLRKPGCTPTR